MRELRLEKKFDAALAMFAVMSYQTSNSDLERSFQTASRHLKPGGLFVFDSWHGPAVLTEKPSQRIMELKRGKEHIIRIANPDLNVLNHTVDVRYTVIHLKDSILISETEETHTMRFLFTREIKYYLKQAGLVFVKFCPFMKIDSECTENDWNITTIARKATGQ